VTDAERPYTLVAELTYRCPLRCVYCSNPLDYGAHGDELDTATWLRVLREAEDLGIVQVNLTGGEPLVRDDLEAIVDASGWPDSAPSAWTTCRSPSRTRQPAPPTGSPA
jgi:pyrroloquinoline quinone biosynthesis protein E